MAKKRRKKKKMRAPLILFILLIVLLVIGGLIYIYRDTITENAKKLSPNVFTYPTEYEEFVIKYSKEYDIDPRYVFAVINTESHFDPNATSDVGARGLMQIMEDAYDWIKFRLDDQREHTSDDMYDPELNIQYGTYMLKYLYDKFDGSYELAAAAYHGGMNAVDGWVADGIVDPENFRLEDVPSDITANYIYKVMNAYNKYKEKLKEDFENG